MHINAGEISKIIKEQIQNYEQRVDATETGTVLSAADCWAWCSTWKKTTWV